MCKAPFYDIRILSVKQPITLLSEKPCYDAQYCAYQNCRNDGADAHTAGTVNSDQAGDNGNQDHGAVKRILTLEKSIPVIWDTACMAPSPASGIRLGGR